VLYFAFMELTIAKQYALRSTFSSLRQRPTFFYELERLIARAKAALGEPPSETETLTESQGLTLHEALKVVLAEHDNRWMTVTDLAEAINSRELYRRRDGAPIQPGQIHARASNYSNMFEKDGPRIRLATQTE
jgi:hypothetical protein